jgi:putative flippase GtrA
VTGPTMVDGLVAKLVHRPEGKHSLLGSFVRFCITGFASVGVDVAILIGLHSGLNLDLFWATLLAYTVGLVVNYTLNRTWTFRARADHRQTLIRYATVVAFNYVSTLLIVLGLTHAGLYYLLSKLIAVALNASINFLAGRFWVFKH